MPAGLFIPPWLQAADPASAYAQGMQIGSRIGQEQAQQQLSEQQMQRQAAKDAADEAYRQQKFQLESDEQARKYAAQQQFESAVGSGMDPAQAWLRYGPRMGIGGTGVAQALRFTQPETMTPFQQAEIDIRNKRLNIPKRFHNSDGTITEVRPDGEVKTLGDPRPKRDPLQIMKDRANLSDLHKQLTAAEDALTKLGPEQQPGTGIFGTGLLKSPGNVQKYEAAKKAVLDIKQAIEQYGKSGGMVAPPSTNAVPKRLKYDVSTKSLVPVGTTSSPSPDDQSDDTEPDE